MKVWKLIPLLFIVFICSCGKENKKQESLSYKHKLVVYATDEFRKSGLEHSIVPPAGGNPFP